MTDVETYEDAVREHDSTLHKFVAQNINIIPDFVYSGRKDEYLPSYHERIWFAFYNELSGIDEEDYILRRLNNGKTRFDDMTVEELAYFIQHYPTVMWTFVMQYALGDEGEDAAFNMLVAADRIDFIDESLELLNTRGNEREGRSMLIIGPTFYSLDTLGAIRNMPAALVLRDWPDEIESPIDGIYFNDYYRLIESDGRIGIVYYFIALNPEDFEHLLLFLNDEYPIDTYERWMHVLHDAIASGSGEMVRRVVESAPQFKVENQEDDYEYLDIIPTSSVAKALHEAGVYTFYPSIWLKPGMGSMIPTIETLRYVMSIPGYVDDGKTSSLTSNFWSWWSVIKHWNYSHPDSLAAVFAEPEFQRIITQMNSDSDVYFTGSMDTLLDTVIKTRDPVHMIQIFENAHLRIPVVLGKDMQKIKDLSRDAQVALVNSPALLLRLSSPEQLDEFEELRTQLNKGE